MPTPLFALLPFLTFGALPLDFDAELEALGRIEVTWPASQTSMAYSTGNSAGVRFRSTNIVKGGNGFFMHGSLYAMCKGGRLHVFARTSPRRLQNHVPLGVF